MSTMILTEPVLLVLKATVLVGAGGLISVLASRAPASVRHLAWSGTLIGVLVLPVLAFGLPSWTVTVLPEQLASTAAAPVEATPVPERAGPIASLPALPFPETGSSPSAPGASSTATAPATAVAQVRGAASDISGLGWLLLAWAAGTGAVLAWILSGQIGVRRLRRRAVAVDDEEWLSETYDAAWLLDIHRPVTLLKGDAAAMPMTWGLLRPTVLLPSTAGIWSAERRRMVLLHELAHVRRKDCLTQLVAHLACAIFWFHPLVWYAARRLRVERERACDDLVVRTGAPAPEYADHLLQVARSLQVPRVAGTAIAMARPSQLEGRLLAVLDPSRPRQDPPLLLRGAAVLLTLVLAVPLAVLRPGVAEAANPGESWWADADGGSGGLFEPGSAAVEPESSTARDEATASGPGALHRPDPDLRWDGTVPRGGSLIVHSWNGPIRATTAGSARASVEGARSDRQRDQREVRLEAVQHAGGVTLCVIPEGAHCTATGIQDDRGVQRSRGARSVDLEVRVPAGVPLQLLTMNGRLQLDGLQSDAEVTTMNGAIRAASSGAVKATTMNGALDVVMSRTDWAGQIALETMNGAIRVTLPDDANTDVSATTMAGSIQSDFPLSTAARPGPRSARGTIGRGGRSLTLTTMNGQIRIIRSGGPVAGAQGGSSSVGSRSYELDDLGGLGPALATMMERSDLEGVGNATDALSRSVEAFSDAMAEMGVSLANGISRGVLAAFGESQPERRTESPEIYIQRLREDPDPEVRRVAAWGLSRTGGPGVSDLARTVASDPDARVREMAAWSLGSLGDPAGAPALRQALRDSDEKVRYSAFWALERVQPQDRASLIRPSLADPSTRIRERGAWLAGDLRARQHVDLLTRAITDDEPRVREKAAWALGRIADPRTLPHLSAALDDPDPAVRKATLWAITRIDQPDVEPLLERASRHADPDIRRLAVGATAGEPWPWPWPWPTPMPRPAP